MTLRVAVVGEFPPGADEGMAIAANGLAAGLAEIGVDVLTLTDANSDSAKFHALRPKTIASIRKFRPTAVLYVPKSGLTQASVARARLLTTLGRPALTGLLTLQADAKPYFPRHRRLLYLTTSRHLAVQAIEQGADAAVVDLGVDPNRFGPDGQAATNLWHGKGRTRLLHVGHLRRGRNVAVLAGLARQGFDCLLVASPTTEPDMSLSEELVQAGVRVVREHVADLSQVYRAADAYVFPVEDPRSCIDLPLSVLEALACGTPVVSTRFGALPERFDSCHAVVFAQPEQFAAAIEELGQRTNDPPVSVVPTWAEAARGLAGVIEKRLTSVDSPRLVLLLGLDGSGKSTQARLLADAARDRGLRAKTVWARWDPLLLKPLILLGRRLARSSGEGTIGSEQAGLVMKRRLFRNRAARVIWAWAASFDHALYSLPKLYCAKHSADLVVSDRYFYDALVDMAVNFDTDVPAPRGLHHLFPRPDRVILLDADEAVLLNRGQDSSSAYLRDRRPHYLHLAKRMGWSVVDASNDIERVQHDIQRQVWADE